MKTAYAVIEEEYDPINEFEEVMGNYDAYIIGNPRYCPDYRLEDLSPFTNLYDEYWGLEKERVIEAFHFYDSQAPLLTDEQIEEVIRAKDCNYGRLANPKAEFLAVCLSIAHSKEYKVHTISGCCQGERAYLILESVPKDEEKLVEYIEACYFGTGTALTIHDTYAEPKTADEVEGYIVYTVEWGTDKIKELIRRYEGADEVVLWKVKEWRRIPVYEQI